LSNLTDFPHQADEEFNIEKLRLVQQEKKKIAVLFERREKQVEVQKKMYVPKRDFLSAFCPVIINRLTRVAPTRTSSTLRASRCSRPRMRTSRCGWDSGACAAWH
jgi:hypothetical protein